MEDNKFYDVELEYTADGITTGCVRLTKQEYEFLKRVTNPGNWENLEAEPYSGCLSVYCEELENQHATKS